MQCLAPVKPGASYKRGRVLTLKVGQNPRTSEGLHNLSTCEGSTRFRARWTLWIAFDQVSAMFDPICLVSAKIRLRSSYARPNLGKAQPNLAKFVQNYADFGKT